MIFPPIFRNTEEIQSLLGELDILREAFKYIPIQQATRNFLREKSLLKSALYSARIEGNTLTFEELAHNDKSVRYQEIANINSALKFIEHIGKQPNIALLKKIHAIVLGGISIDAGLLRAEESAIFNQAGVAVYLSPPPQNVTILLDSLCAWIRDTTDPLPIVAATAHIWFEKIHPFLDGNGRVGRVLVQVILARGGYQFTGVLPFEEYLDTHRQEYYDALTVDKQDVTEFIVFFVNSLIVQARRSLEELKTPLPREQILLPPRRAELLNVIRDHPMTTFDFLRRRFFTIPVSSLHYDLSQLAKGGYIQKVGSTRGALYTPKIN